MKRCPSCNRTFDDETLSFCQHDGTSLIDDASSAQPAAPPVELQATMMATPPSLGGGSYPPPASPPSPGSGSFNSPQSNTTWVTPSAQQAPPPPKSGGMNKKLLFGGIGCLALLVIVGIVGIVMLFALSGPDSKMNPYKGDLKDLAPEYVGGYKRVDVDDLKDKEKEDFGSFNNAIGVTYKVSSTRIDMFVGNYSSSKDADDALRAFKDKAVGKSFTASELGKKKLGWRTVGGRFVMTKSPSTSKADEIVLPDGATIVRAQASEMPTPTPTPERKQSQIVGWTNGSVVFWLFAEGTDAVDFEKIFDGIKK